MGGGAEAIERAMEGDMFLKALKGVWDDHTGSMHKLTAVLRYMVSRRPSFQVVWGDVISDRS